MGTNPIEMPQGKQTTATHVEVTFEDRRTRVRFPAAPLLEKPHVPLKSEGMGRHPKQLRHGRLGRWEGHLSSGRMCSRRNAEEWKSDMHIKYENDMRAPGARTFQELIPGTWYQGCQTGRLYFFYISQEGKPRLLRCDDNQDCTSRFQRGGTFRPVEVTVTVHNTSAQAISA